MSKNIEANYFLVQLGDPMNPSTHSDVWVNHWEAETFCQRMNDLGIETRWNSAEPGLIGELVTMEQVENAPLCVRKCECGRLFTSYDLGETDCEPCATVRDLSEEEKGELTNEQAPKCEWVLLCDPEQGDLNEMGAIVGAVKSGSTQHKMLKETCPQLLIDETIWDKETILNEVVKLFN